MNIKQSARLRITPSLAAVVVLCIICLTAILSQDAFAQDMSSTIDVTVTEKLKMTGSTSTTDLNASDFEIINNSESSLVSAQINLQNAGNWTAKAYTTAWGSEATGSKVYGLKAGDKDLYATIGGSALSIAEDLDKGENKTVEITGKIAFNYWCLARVPCP